MEEELTPLVRPDLPADLEYLRPLAKGKKGKVHLAREPELERLVVVKVLPPELSADETTRLRFEREARAAASLMHAHVVPVYCFGWLSDGSPYLVMAHVKGRTLTDHLEARGPMEETEALDLIGGLASALAAAHGKGIVHRNVQPDNVLVEEDSGSALLSNFGLARILEAGASKSPQLTHTGQVLGEPHYSAPEQLRGEEVTEQADIYSLGILAYEVLTGEGPYRAKTNAAWIQAHLNEDPIPVSQLRTGVSPELETLLLRCLATKPSQRPRAKGNGTGHRLAPCWRWLRTDRPRRGGPRGNSAPHPLHSGGDVRRGPDAARNRVRARIKGCVKERRRTFPLRVHQRLPG